MGGGGARTRGQCSRGGKAGDRPLGTTLLRTGRSQQRRCLVPVTRRVTWWGHLIGGSRWENVQLEDTEPSACVPCPILWPQSQPVSHGGSSVTCERGRGRDGLQSDTWPPKRLGGWTWCDLGVSQPASSWQEAERTALGRRAQRVPAPRPEQSGDL